MACNLENICVALERIFEYTNLPPEAEWNFQDKNLDNWPNCGKINFSQFQTCYRKGMEPVLNKIDLIEPEKRKSAIEKVKLSGIRMLRIYKLIFKSNFSDEEESVHDFEEYQI